MNNDFLQKVNEEISVEENTQLTDPDKMELAPEVRAALIDEILDLHHEYEYKSTTYLEFSTKEFEETLRIR